MKCEICHQADAETAIVRTDSEGGEELYVCKACAQELRRAKQKRSQRTRKVSELPPGMSITVSGNADAPPPILGAILDAVNGMVSDLEKAKKKASSSKAPTFRDFPVERVESTYRYAGKLHLEGLHLIGELEAVKRAMHALHMELVGADADGVKSAGHAFGLRYSGSQEQAKRVVEDLIAQEQNARVRLLVEMPRMFGDSLCRALAILKNCRLLSPGELFDLLSPLRLSLLENMLDGVSLDELDSLVTGLDLSGAEDKLGPNDRDRIDAERADEINRKFEDVVLNERAEGMFL